MAAAQGELPVAFEVDGIDADRRAGWSVLVRGDARPVDDPEEIARLNRLVGVWPWADATVRDPWVRIRTQEISWRKVLHGPQQ